MSIGIPAIEAELAHRECDLITRRAAANFFYGIRLLPRVKRDAMSAVYAFARRVDDIGDDGGEPERQLARLGAERAMLARLAAGESIGLDPVHVALAHAHLRSPLPLDALEQLIDGVEMDVSGTRYETFDELVVYCRCVAGSIGRLCLAIFSGERDGDGARLADELGVAMQLTNILRDVLEDHARGRVYLPARDLERFGCERLPDVDHERAAALIAFEAARAQEWFDRGRELVARLDPRSAACVLAMSGIYLSILHRIVADPAAVLRHRVSVPVWEKAWLATRSLATPRLAAVR